MAAQVLTYYLYKIVNEVNDKVYIGVTSDPKRRWWQHKRRDSACVKLRRAMNKHGRDKFRMVLLCAGSAEYILALESVAIHAYMSIDGGYNIQSGGAEGYGYTPETYPTDTPTYVSGFWFPSARMGRKVLQISRSTFKDRKKSGTLGETYISRAPARTKVPLPVFVRGFWFPTAACASAVMGLGIRRIHTLFREEKKNASKCLDV